MKKAEFQIGQEFYTNTGKWRCTDIGSRVIIAIHLDEENPENNSGPPYSIVEQVFDEYDLDGCSLDSTDFEEAIDDIIKTRKFSDIEDALMFVSGAGYGEASAILDKQTWKIYYRSDLMDIDELEDKLADEDYDPNIHIKIPHKNDLDLGRNLVFEFIEQSMPDYENQVDKIFSKRGAYSRYKDFLDAKGMLQKWYDFENRREQIALIQWCKENEIDIMG